jgi:hypothetical protein
MEVALRVTWVALGVPTVCELNSEYALLLKTNKSVVFVDTVSFRYPLAQLPPPVTG